MYRFHYQSADGNYLCGSGQVGFFLPDEQETIHKVIPLEGHLVMATDLYLPVFGRQPERPFVCSFVIHIRLVSTTY